jgi:hypothetical protein
VSRSELCSEQRSPSLESQHPPRKSAFQVKFQVLNQSEKRPLSSAADTLQFSSKSEEKRRANSAFSASTFVSRLSRRPTNTKHRRRQRIDPFEDFLSDHSGVQQRSEERFAKQAKLLSADSQLFKVYAAAMRFRSQDVMTRQMAMSDETLYENAKFFHENNYRIHSKGVTADNIMRDDWEGPQNIRELIGQVSAGIRMRRGAVSEERKGVVRQTLVKDLSSGFKSAKTKISPPISPSMHDAPQDFSTHQQGDAQIPEANAEVAPKTASVAGSAPSSPLKDNKSVLRPKVRQTERQKQKSTQEIQFSRCNSEPTEVLKGLPNPFEKQKYGAVLHEL